MNPVTVRYALISDIHANLPALEAVLGAIARRDNIDATLHLGDLVGYAPWPDETIDVLRARGIQGVAGNYDSTVATRYKHCGCRYEDARQEALSRLSFEWTLRNVNESSRRHLATLPFRIDLRPAGGHVSGPTVTLVHGNETLNTVYVTHDRPDKFLARMAHSLGARAGDVVAFGHTHLPFHRTVGGVHFVNGGSVGRPKDGDPRAGYVILTIDAGAVHVEFNRVHYDVERAAQGILASALPSDFADYLRAGGTPATAGMSSSGPA